MVLSSSSLAKKICGVATVWLVAHTWGARTHARSSLKVSRRGHGLARRSHMGRAHARSLLAQSFAARPRFGSSLAQGARARTLAPHSKISRRGHGLARRSHMGRAHARSLLALKVLWRSHNLARRFTSSDSRVVVVLSGASSTTTCAAINIKVWHDYVRPRFQS